MDIVTSDGVSLKLADGGSRLSIDGEEQKVGRLYLHNAKQLAGR